MDDNVDLGAEFNEQELQRLLDSAAPGWTISIHEGDYRVYRVTDGHRKFVDTRWQDAFGRACFIAKDLGELVWDGLTWRIQNSSTDHSTS